MVMKRPMVTFKRHEGPSYFAACPLPPRNLRSISSRVLSFRELSPGIEKQLAPLVLKGYLALKRQLHDNRLHYRYELLTA